MRSRKEEGRGMAGWGGRGEGVDGGTRLSSAAGPALPPLGSIAPRFIPFPPIMHRDISPRSVGFEISPSLCLFGWKAKSLHHTTGARVKVCSPPAAPLALANPPRLLLVSQPERLFTSCFSLRLFSPSQVRNPILFRHDRCPWKQQPQRRMF